LIPCATLPPNDEITSFGTVNDLLDLQSDVLCKHLPGMAGRHKVLGLEEVEVGLDEVNHVGLGFVVCNQGERWEVSFPRLHEAVTAGILQGNEERR
jgi:hypothetical protein